jgi:hypothetical protein
MDDKKKLEPTKKLTQKDGTIMYIWESKLHRWEGPALIPQGDNKKREYYLYGIKYTEKQWKEHCKQREGLPWFKSSSGKTSGARV